MSYEKNLRAVLYQEISTYNQAWAEFGSLYLSKDEEIVATKLALANAKKHIYSYMELKQMARGMAALVMGEEE